MEYVAVLGGEEERESECCGGNMSAPSRKEILLLLETARTDDSFKVILQVLENYNF